MSLNIQETPIYLASTEAVTGTDVAANTTDVATPDPRETRRNGSMLVPLASILRDGNDVNINTIAVDFTMCAMTNGDSVTTIIQNVLASRRYTGKMFLPRPSHITGNIC